MKRKLLAVVPISVVSTVVIGVHAAFAGGFARRR